MPRRQHQEWLYTCGHCGTETDAPIHLSPIGNEWEALILGTPDWTLILHNEEWFCSVECFMQWLRIKITNAVLAEHSEATADEDTDEYASDWPFAGMAV